MERQDLLKYREYLWNYFQMHAEQRLKTFNFYLVVSAIFIGAFVNIIKEQIFSFSVILPLIFSFISIVFWSLDKRTRQMIRNAEVAIKTIDDTFIEQTEEPNPINIFRFEEYVTKRFNKTNNPLNRQYTYSMCFNAIFFIFFILGLLTSVFFLIESLHVFSACNLQ